MIYEGMMEDMGLILLSMNDTNRMIDRFKKKYSKENIDDFTKTHLNNEKPFWDDMVIGFLRIKQSIEFILLHHLNKKNNEQLLSEFINDIYKNNQK